MNTPSRRPRQSAAALRPRLGFLGVGWIGRQRLAAVAESGLAEITLIADAEPSATAEAALVAPEAALGDGLEAALRAPIDGLVIATPSAAHARQAIAALEHGLAVFCQKPLGRNQMEARQVVAAARRANRLLGVDFSYRYVRGMEEIRRMIRAGELGEPYVLDLTFHNAYGPDKPWFYDMAQSGGGCVMDLGTHLVDMALWMQDSPKVKSVHSRLYAGGKPLSKPVSAVEDYAVAEIEFDNGAIARIACSWRLPAGRDCIIDLAFYGTAGAASLHNIDGSFYDFVVERHRGTACETIAAAPDAWGGRALLDWTRRLATDPRFDPEAEHLAQVSTVIDAIYGR